MQFSQLTNETVEKSDAHYLVDYAGAGEMLVISFGFYDYNRNPGFDFYGRLRKMEVLSGRKLNKIFIRDKSSSWYLQSIPGLGDNPDEIAASLKKIIAEIAPSKVVTIGQSMGAYAAILYGALLEVDQVIAFGPLSTFHPEKLEILNDKRWLGEAKRCYAEKGEVYYEDLPELIKSQAGKKTVFELIYGTKPGDNGDRSEAVNFDAAHALRFYGLGNVRFLPFNTSKHAIIQHLKDIKLIDQVLLHRLFGNEFVINDAHAPLQEAWMKWIRENIELGCKAVTLQETLKGQGVTDEVALNAIYRVQAERNYLNLTGQPVA